MINKECFTTEWIAQKSIELKYKAIADAIFYSKISEEEYLTNI